MTLKKKILYMIISCISFFLLSNAVSPKRESSILYSREAILVLLYSLLITFNFYTTYLSKGIGIFGGLFQATSHTQAFHLFILVITTIILQLTAFYPRKVLNKDSSFFFLRIKKESLHNILLKKEAINMNGEEFKIIEYPLIILFIITGALFLVSTSDLVSLFLSLELQSYGLYLICTLYRNSELSTAAGLTYFILGGLASCFILLGTSLLYANSGTTSLDGFYILTSLSSITKDESILFLSKPFYLNISLLIMSVGFLFKISAAPFHFWSPDVYDAIPTKVTTFVAIVSKISLLVFLLELVHYTNSSYIPFNFNWKSSLLLSSLLSMIIGTVLGLIQYRIKRLFAYSTISHLGFILLALTVNTLESSQAFVFYLMQYSVANLNAFFILISIGFSLYLFVNKDDTKKRKNMLIETNYSRIQLIKQMKGYFFINSYLALCLAITLFSFVGVPPLIGFFAKQMVLSAALDSGYVFITLIAILTSVISAVYYLVVIKKIFFEKTNYKLKPIYKKASLVESSKNNLSQKDKFTPTKNNIVLSNSLTITVSVLTLTLLLFVFTPQEILSMANILALMLFNS